MVTAKKQKIGGGYESIGGERGDTMHRFLTLWFTLKKFIKLPVRKFLGTPKKETILESLKLWLGL